MDKWNFDFVFSGTLDERGKKANAFLQGIELLRKDIQVQFAMAHLTSEDPKRRWSELNDLREMETAFCQDPRTKAILLEKTTEQFGEVGKKAIDQLFECLDQVVRSEQEER